jgi:ABC-type molybdenum transport system ATPase subunit/photorepair protein PhrA
MADSQDTVDDSDWLRHAVASGAIQVAKLEAEIARLRLTDAEREAIERLCEAVTDYAADDRKVNGETFAAGDERAVAIVRGWLARLNTGD